MRVLFVVVLLGGCGESGQCRFIRMSEQCLAEPTCRMNKDELENYRLLARRRHMCEALR